MIFWYILHEIYHKNFNGLITNLESWFNGISYIFKNIFTYSNTFLGAFFADFRWHLWKIFPPACLEHVKAINVFAPTIFKIMAPQSGTVKIDLDQLRTRYCQKKWIIILPVSLSSSIICLPYKNGQDFLDVQ